MSEHWDWSPTTASGDSSSGGCGIPGTHSRHRLDPRHSHRTLALVKGWYEERKYALVRLAAAHNALR